eukprot:gnl/MRDRNA2_/MRDRNA2_91732_c1_seq1.p1 gnl/MRDRNA2_/MRDRNA2_91732_c1~~gnl/MRDRNA2_/MRDRNA2_91732_c1_seq1.p1  ORF type:complete len:211 (+),score=54.47 gnl/MRDRNA2_/MRDRNA2_91732_c1_seq1:85-717(+)
MGGGDIKKGCKVEIDGTPMHGSIGEAVEWLTDKDRWKIKFPSGSTKNFKIENLSVFDDAKPPLPEGCTKFWKIYITNLSKQVTKQNLLDYFSKVGTIAKERQVDRKGAPVGYKDQWPHAVKLYKPGEQGGDALLEFEDSEAAWESLRQNGKEFLGSKIGVEVAGKQGKSWHASSKPPKSADNTDDRQRSRSREERKRSRSRDRDRHRNRD